MPRRLAQLEEQEQAFVLWSNSFLELFFQRQFPSHPYSKNWRLSPELNFILYTKCRVCEAITMSGTNLEESEGFTAHVLGEAMVQVEDEGPQSLAVFTGRVLTTRLEDVDPNLVDSWLTYLQLEVVRQGVVVLP